MRRILILTLILSLLSCCFSQISYAEKVTVLQEIKTLEEQLNITPENKQLLPRLAAIEIKLTGKKHSGSIKVRLKLVKEEMLRLKSRQKDNEQLVKQVEELEKALGINPEDKSVSVRLKYIEEIVFGKSLNGSMQYKIDQINQKLGLKTAEPVLENNDNNIPFPLPSGKISSKTNRTNFVPSPVSVSSNTKNNTTLTSSFTDNKTSIYRSSSNPVNYCRMNFNYNQGYGDYFNTRSTQQYIPFVWKKCPVTISLYSVPEKFRPDALAAINKWQNFFPLEVVDTQEADIIFQWTNKKRLKFLCKNSLALGVAHNEIIDGKRICTIYVLSKRKYIKDQLEAIILHEMGHALGLGHSNHPGDIMYHTSKARKGGISQLTFFNIGFIPVILPTGFRKGIKGNTIITHRDANTLWRMYNLDSSFSDNLKY